MFLLVWRGNDLAQVRIAECTDIELGFFLVQGYQQAISEIEERITSGRLPTLSDELYQVRKVYKAVADEICRRNCVAEEARAAAALADHHIDLVAKEPVAAEDMMGRLSRILAWARGRKSAADESEKDVADLVAPFGARAYFEARTRAQRQKDTIDGNRPAGL
ncbi:hypothetical protein [Methylocella tundrae]|uniref:Uncharacterized protein n=1 Tax=Methylocella tundrae TaxID=227605 RepID=A0A4U8YW78_METTU|nr:hypothetical protein [Methylocella tundrae]WPP04794.1 hypothetical protein SIN04_02885 [Methylocella tundrae]VFU07020.1 protein of unknown function [Methylocella tundrae]